MKQIHQSKKATIAWDEIVKWVLILAAIIIGIGIIVKLSGSSTSIWEKIKDTLRFGA